MHCDKQADDWAEQNGSKLPKMSAGKSHMYYCGSADELPVPTEHNPRMGSTVYTSGDEYEMLIEFLPQSKIPGAPAMPIWQWHKCHDDGRKIMALR